MTLALSLQALLDDEGLRRREFPVTTEALFLAHAAVCPLPARVMTAISDYLVQSSRHGQFEHLHRAAEANARARAASLLGACPDEIAFVPSTSAGLSLVAGGLGLGDGDSVVIAAGDFPSNVFPWLQLRHKGVEVRPIPSHDDGLVTVQDVLAHLDDTTRLVALSSAHFATGAAIDLDAIGEALQQRDVLFCLDAIQTLGAFPVSVRHVDFLVADAHKWLLGPQGMGIMYVRSSQLSRLSPVLLGWKSVASSRDFRARELDLAPTARRYEPGSLNALGLIGLNAALELLELIGPTAIAARLRKQREHLEHGLRALGFEVLGGPQAAESGIVSVRRDDRDMRQLYAALDAQRMITSIRPDPLGRPCLRLAPHFYNTQTELTSLLDALERETLTTSAKREASSDGDK